MPDNVGNNGHDVLLLSFPRKTVLIKNFKVEIAFKMSKLQLCMTGL